jgi:uncharacterized protein (TIGR03000 family)
MNATHLLLAGVTAASLALPAQAQGFRRGGMPGRPPAPAPRPAGPGVVNTPVLPPGAATAVTPPAARALNYPRVSDVSPAAVVRGLPGETHFRPNHMPGWDWWRYYPYVNNRYPYYPPYPYPYPSPYPYPAPYPYPVYTPGTAVSTPAVPAVSDLSGAAREVPSVSGPLAVPPPRTAILRVRVPDPSAQVAFDGQNTATTGTVRTFVTPTFRTADPQTYTVTANWVRNGMPVSERREVSIQSGQVRTVDFTQPAAW